jgi:hypothetical protein
MGMLNPLLNRKSDLSVRNGAVLYKQLLLPMMDYARPAWRLEVLNSKFPPCYSCALVRNRQIHEDMGVPLFGDHIRALTVSFDLKLADVGNILVRQLGRYLRWPRVDPVAWRVSPGRQEPAGQSTPSPALAKSTKRIALGPDEPTAFRLPWLKFSMIFLSCDANARVYDEKSGHDPHSCHQARWFYLSA